MNKPRIVDELHEEITDFHAAVYRSEKFDIWSGYDTEGDNHYVKVVVDRDGKECLSIIDIDSPRYLDIPGTVKLTEEEKQKFIQIMQEETTAVNRNDYINPGDSNWRAARCFIYDAYETCNRKERLDMDAPMLDYTVLGVE